MPSPIFSAETFPPHKKDDKDFKARYSKILTVSRERYCKSRKFVESKINRDMKELEKQEKSWEKKKEELKNKKK